jgi:hypothetical protein
MKTMAAEETQTKPAASAPSIEPWMRGPIPDVHPFLQPMLFTFQQVREDLAKWTEELSTDQLWATPHGFGSTGFHIRHIGGSTDRLLTYALGSQLSSEQIAFLKAEKNHGATREELLAELDAMLQHTEEIIRKIDPATLTDARGVGRKMLPTTVIGLLVHISEHAQRHVGQAISAAKLAKVT